MPTASRITALGSYENRLLGLLSLAESSMFIDRLALGFLTPFLVEELALSNTALGLLSSGFSLTLAVSGYLIGKLADRSQRPRGLLITCTSCFSLLSAACGLTHSALALFLVRVLLGVAEGPYLPILQSVMMPQSSPGRRGFNAGFLQNVIPMLLGQLAGPIVLTQVATSLGWRMSFVLTALPGLLLIPFLHRMVRPPTGRSSVGRSASGDQGVLELLRVRNVLLCVCMAACTGTWILLQNTFLPQYLVKACGYTPTQMGFVVSFLGTGSLLASLTLPALSDRIGRKPVLIGGFSCGLAAPLGALFAGTHPVVVACSMALGSCLLGCTPLTVTLVPSDSIGGSALIRAMGLPSASSAFFGGVLMPLVGGWMADRFGLQAPIWMALLAPVIGIGFALGLRSPRLGTSASADRH